MHILHEASLGQLAVCFRVLINISKCLSLSRIDVSIDSLVENSQDIVFGEAFFRKSVISESYLLFLESLLNVLDRFLLKIFLLFVTNEADIIAQSQQQLGHIAHQTHLSSGFDSNRPTDQSNKDKQDDDMLCNSVRPFC